MFFHKLPRLLSSCGRIINKSLIIRNNLLKLDVIRDFKAAHKQISNIVEMKEIEVELINRILGSLKDAITKE